ncbi:MAG: hypothetical protein H0U63_04150 [Burkholderiales bacterium]|nr:hypothetical protein [Burkholderiales bacterium]
MVNLLGSEESARRTDRPNQKEARAGKLTRSADEPQRPVEASADIPVAAAFVR